MQSPIILLIIAVGLFYSFTSKEYQEVKGLQENANKYQEVLQNISKVVELKNDLLQTYSSFPEEEVERITKMLPDDVDTVKLALDLDGLAAKYGVTIRNIQTAIAPERADSVLSNDIYGRAAVTFSFISNYDNFLKVLTDLERNLRVMDIKLLSFDATETGLYEYQFVVDTYWLK